MDIVAAVLHKGRSLDEALSQALARVPYADLPAKDRGLARLIATTVLRRHGQLEAIVGTFIDRPLPRDRGALTPILLAGAAQLVFLGIAPHAVLNIAVEQARRDRGACRFARLVNAVLRRVAELGADIAARQDAARLNTPDWLWTRWSGAYGEDVTRKIVAASLREAPLDLSVISDAEDWAARLGGHLLPTGSVRMRAEGRIDELPGYAEGAWWVQDAAAALPAKLLGCVRGQRVADICAAPGGKTAGLAAEGALVTAVDISSDRLGRLAANLTRLKLDATLVAADATTWNPEQTFDGVLVDAPCLATGTIRRHPDVLRLKRSSDLDRLRPLQEKLLANAGRMVRPGGLLVYCTCSLEPEEGPHQIEHFLRKFGGQFVRVPVEPGEIGAEPEWITPAGDLRTFPFQLDLPDPSLSGLDGFYAARLRRVSSTHAQARA